MSTNVDEAPQPKRRGRPATGKRGTFTFRVTETLRASLEAEAQDAKRPVSEIIEQKLEHSIADREILMAVIGRGIQDKMFRMLAKVVREARSFAIITKKSECEAREIIRAASLYVLDVYLWRGGELSVQGHVGVHGKPVALTDQTPEEIGVEIAESAMMLDDDPMMQELVAERISDRWTGRGDKEVQIEVP